MNILLFGLVLATTVFANYCWFNEIVFNKFESSRSRVIIVDSTQTELFMASCACFFGKSVFLH